MTSYLPGLPDLRRDAIALYTIPAFWLIAVTPRFLSMRLYEKQTGSKFDPRAPRNFTESVTHASKLDQDTKGFIVRGEAAMLNSFENFGPFTAAVVAGSAAKLNPATLNGLTIAYLGSRVVYNWVYMNSTTIGMGYARSMSYLTGLGCLFAMFIQAGTKFKNAVL
ncbi:hypothetical protein CKM354_000100900 [Cercospora kikuchii]|uniref:Uncharacterized protein n=1 Tax=Cercospora kikuchii TaxID=84275 RepID=A0A9P3CBZ6_9PEZI|nr:uncharacterized protein CKM354_000100900 [Cercospora kikuchii]GIZ37565.1 hypothetical protein CKM354_000100900 [Cercospora kikuchii]